MSAGHGPERFGLAGDPHSRVHRLDPRAKVVGLVGVTVVAVSAPLALWPVFVACALVLAAVAAVARVPPAEVWRRAGAVLVLVALAAVFLPFVRPGGQSWALGPLTVHEAGLGVLATVAVKAGIGAASAVLLAATTAFPAVLRGLEALRVPRLLVLIAALMHRYLAVVAGDAVRVRRALAARAYRPRHALQAQALGRVAGTLFLRTHGRAERVHLAMVSRGWGGAMPALTPLAFTRGDLAFVVLVAVALVPLRLALAL